MLSGNLLPMASLPWITSLSRLSANATKPPAMLIAGISEILRVRLGL